MSGMIQSLFMKTNRLKIIYVEDPKTGKTDHINRCYNCDNYNEKDR